MANIGFKEDFKNNMYHASFTAWQINETIKGMVNGKSNNGTTFNEYVKKLGIDDKPDKKEDSNYQRQVQKEQALKTAENIIQLDRKGRKKKDGRGI